MSMHEKARATIEKYGMIGRGDTIAAGVSGGADSVALLHFLLTLRAELELNITALQVNHGLRGAESDADEAFVRQLCERLGVKLLVRRADVKGVSEARGLSLEEAGRAVRYEFFESAARELGAKIATAHTLSDSAETVVLNFARGSALRGLCGIPPVRGGIIRPLIECERLEIERYCAQNGLDYVHDGSNDSDEFARNRIRHHVIPALLSVNSAMHRTLAPNLESLRADADYLDKLAQNALAEVTVGENRFDRAAYLDLERPIAFRVLISALSRLGISTDYARVSRLHGIIQKGTGAEQLSAGFYLKSEMRIFTISAPDTPPDFFSISINLADLPEYHEIDVFSDKKLCLMNTDYEYYEENIKYGPKPLKNVIDCDKIYGIVKCRQKMAGDEIKLLGRGCTKTIKKLMQEAGIPIAERGKILVLADSKGPVWVEGFGVGERAAVTSAAKRVLLLDAKNKGEDYDQGHSRGFN